MSHLIDIFFFFSRLGLIGFGGPSAHIALLQQEAQEKRGWLTKEEFTDGLAVCNILPGPTSTQFATYLGWLRGGLRGGLVAAFGFIWPAFVLMLLFSWLYFTYGTMAQVSAFFYGLKPVVVAIVLATTWQLAKPWLNDYRFWVICLGTALLIGTRLINDFLVFLGAGFIGLWLYAGDTRQPTGKQPVPKEDKFQGKKFDFSLLAIGLGLSEAPTGEIIGFFSHSGDIIRLGQLAWFFIRAGTFIFGGGLIIIPLIENEVVQGFGWLSHQQFLDGVALGQATPGPVTITATFVGYASAGVSGALVATVAIFAPGLTLILLAAPSLQKVKQISWARAAFKGLNGAVVGSLLAGVYFIGQTAFILPRTSQGGLEAGSGKIFDFYTFALALASFFLILRYRLNTIYLFLAFGGLGILLSLLPFRLPGSGLAG